MTKAGSPKGGQGRQVWPSNGVFVKLPMEKPCSALKVVLLSFSRSRYHGGGDVTKFHFAKS